MKAPGDFWVEYKMLGLWVNWRFHEPNFDGLDSLTQRLNGMFWVKVHHESMQVACTPLNLSTS